MFTSRFLVQVVKPIKANKLFFWIGITLGVFYSFVFYLLLSYTIEVMRYLVIERNGVFGSSPQENIYYSLFYATFSSIIGYAITLYTWAHSDSIFRNKHHQANLLFWAILFIFFMVSVGFKLIFFAYFGWGITKDQFSLYSDYGGFLFLFPTLLFFLIWQSFRSFFWFKYHFWVSFFVVALVAICLHSLLFVNPQRLNDAVIQTFAEEHTTISSELLRIEEQYGITYEERTIRILYMWQGLDMQELIWETSSHFYNDEPVPLDIILLHQISLKIGVRGNWYRNIHNWNHPKPNRILYHIDRNESTSPEKSELIETLSIFIHSANASLAKYYPELNLEVKPVRSRHLTSYPFPQEIMKELQEVWEKYNLRYCQNKECILIPKPVQIQYF